MYTWTLKASKTLSLHQLSKIAHAFYFSGKFINVERVAKQINKNVIKYFKGKLIEIKKKIRLLLGQVSRIK